jgi:transcriptional regulator with XRE-family HTH domain
VQAKFLKDHFHVDASPNAADQKLFAPARRMGHFITYLRRDFEFPSQAAFAERLGVSRSYLANIESGRTPIKLKTAWDVCRLLDLHPDFLISCGKNNRAPFPILPTGEAGRAEALINALQATDFVVAWGAVRDVLFEPEADQVLAPSGLAEKNELTTTSEIRKVEDVKSEIEKLLARVRGLVSAKGMKAKLAATLGVPQSRLSEWLGGTCEPSGETTLRLLKWVEQQERQK